MAIRSIALRDISISRALGEAAGTRLAEEPLRDFWGVLLSEAGKGRVRASGMLWWAPPAYCSGRGMAEEAEGAEEEEVEEEEEEGYTSKNSIDVAFFRHIVDTVGNFSRRQWDACHLRQGQ